MSSYVVNWNWAWLALTMAPVLWVMVRWRRNAHQLECELVNGIKKSRDLPAEAMFIVEPMDHVGDWLLNNGHIDWETVTMLIKDGRTDEVVEALVRCGPIADDVDADFRRSLLYFLSAEKASYDELVAKGLIREKVDYLVQSLLKDGRIDWEVVAELIRSGRIDETIEGLIRCGPTADEVEADYRRSLLDVPAIKAKVQSGHVDDAIRILRAGLGNLPMNAGVGSSDA